MSRFVIMIALLTAVGCGGGGDSKSTGTGQAGSGGGHEGAASVDLTGAAAKLSETATAVKGCLDLVAAKKYSDAVASCTRAAGLEPENERVQQALATAKSALVAAAASAANAKQAAGEAVNDAKKAADEAASKTAEDASRNVDEAAKGLLGGTH